MDTWSVSSIRGFAHLTGEVWREVRRYDRNRLRTPGRFLGWLEGWKMVMNFLFKPAVSS